jgi:hypothetical protein
MSAGAGSTNGGHKNYQTQPNQVPMVIHSSQRSSYTLMDVTDNLQQQQQFYH